VGPDQLKFCIQNYKFTLVVSLLFTSHHLVFFKTLTKNLSS